MKGIDLVIQELKAPKARWNKFSEFHYRSCEDILEAVKPLLKTHGLSMYISDEPVLVGTYNYIKATVTISDGEKTLSVSAVAREAESRKGMDTSQITGATSSYARKYALNGLFLIDDNRDADGDKPAPEKEVQPASAEQKKYLAELASNFDGDQSDYLLKASKSDKLSYEKAEQIIAQADAALEGRA